MEEPEIPPPRSSGRTSCADSKSPEFEFWMVRNPSFPQPNLLSADELFSDGILLPLHHLHLSSDTPTLPQAHGLEPEASATESAGLSAGSTLISSKRWRNIFRKNEKKSTQEDNGAKERDNTVRGKRREKKNGGAGNGATAAELNINIWPFSRSRSAGNGGTRPRPAAATRKVSSAPCSRSNSRGESKSRKWTSSPGRPGVHLGRSSPVWQVRRATGGGGRSSEAAARSAEKGIKKDGNESRRKVPVASGSKARVLSLKVPLCIGYRQQLSCRSDESSVVGAAAVGGISGEGVRGSNLFNIKSLFTRKVY